MSNTTKSVNNAPSKYATATTIQSKITGRTYSGSAKFPCKLHAALSDGSCALAWNPEGTTFTILGHSEEAFSSCPSLAKHFNNHAGIKRASFIRKLHRWGFRRAGADGADTFSHPCFQRNRPELLYHMRNTSPARACGAKPAPVVSNMATVSPVVASVPRFAVALSDKKNSQRMWNDDALASGPAHMPQPVNNGSLSWLARSINLLQQQQQQTQIFATLPPSSQISMVESGYENYDLLKSVRLLRLQKQQKLEQQLLGQQQQQRQHAIRVVRQNLEIFRQAF